MKIEEVRKYLTNLKLHIDQIESWTMQATDMIYQIEENLFDIEDKEYSKKYETKCSMKFLKEAASRTYQMIDSPPRLNSSRCGNEYIAAAGFYQSNFRLTKIV